MNPTRRLIEHLGRASNEERRGTVLTPPVLAPDDTAGERSRVWTITVEAGFGAPMRGVIVQSQTGTGGRRYAEAGKPVLLKRSLGGRWVAVGPADRTASVGTVQLLDETLESGLGAQPGPGFTRKRRPWPFYQGNWGTAGFGITIVLDADGNEVFDQ